MKTSTKKKESAKAVGDQKRSSIKAGTSASVMKPGVIEKGSTSTLAESALPRRLEQTTHRVDPLLAYSEAKSATHLVASKRVGDEVSRKSLMALYQLAYSLRRQQPITSSSGSSSTLSLGGGAPLPYHAPRVEASAAKHTTSDQIWGQMNVLLRPVLRRLQDRVRVAQKLYGGGKSGAGAASSKKKKQQAKKKSKGGDYSDEDEGDEDEEHDDDDDGEEEEGGQRQNKSLEEASLSDLSEEELDEEIARLLEEQKARRRAKKSASSAGAEGIEDDTWRYAFGKGGLDEDEDEDEDEEGADERKKKEDAWGDDDDGEEAGEEDLASKVARRNRMAMLAAEDDDEEGEEGVDGDAEEELAALRELYGEDYEDDGQGFLGDEEEEEGDDDEGEPAEDDEMHPENMYRDQDGQFYGYDNILEDHQDGLFEDRPIDEDVEEDGGEGGSGAPPRAADDLDAELAKDEELQAFLQRDDVTELEKERMLEKKKVLLMEQRRLFGVNQWSMAGETSAQKRPREALLELDQLDFEYGMKTVPVITESVTLQLEERIKQRILNSQYDDVVRRVATTLSTPEDLSAAEMAKKAKHAAEGEKSKLSLMDLYEKEYMERQRQAEEAAGVSADAPTAEPLTAIERDELRAIHMWKRLGQHLDALSNFYFTPKPVKQDLEARVRAVDGQAPALAMETVGNFAANREAALAPQDVYRPRDSGAAYLTGSAEMSPAERRAQRRRLKEKNAVRHQIVEQNKKKLQKQAKEKKEAAAAAVEKAKRK